MAPAPSPVVLPALPPGLVTRFAPSPTGPLHLGHVAHLVWLAGVAQAARATVLLRIEDHDRGRSRPEFEAAILRDLEWLGIDLAPDRPRYRQSDHPDRYQGALERLQAAGLVYACRCTRREIAERSPVAPGEEPRYPGTCRGLGLPIERGRTRRVILPADRIDFVDLLDGPASQVPADQCGDLALKDATGNWTYQFSVTVDDLEDGVTLVVRGRDLAASTGRQILLARLLGRAEPPRFLHHPLVMAPGGLKLSKRDHAPAIRDLASAGATPAEVLGRAAQLTGLLAEPVPLPSSELGRLFRIAG